MMFSTELMVLARLKWMASRIKKQADSPPWLAVVGSEPGAVNLLASPESGWTDAERKALDASGWRQASLGAPVLRAETAAIAALAIAGQC